MLVLLLAAFAIFIVGNVWRIVATLRMPRPLRWDLYPIPRGPIARQHYGGSYFEDTDWWTHSAHGLSRNEPLFILKEVLLLRSVYESFHHLWLWSWMLHWGLYLYIAATVLSLLAAPASVVQLLYFVATVTGFIGAVGLLMLRLKHPRLRGHSSRATMFNLVLLAVLFATGAFAADHGFSVRTALPNSSAAIRVHLVVVAFFLAYFPLTHMTHAFMKFFTWHQVRWNDRASIHDSGAGSALAVNLQRHATWSAPHIAAEGKSWEELVTRERA